MHPADRLAARIAATGSMACIGLDPRPALLPPTLVKRIRERHGDGVDAVAAAFLDYNRNLLDAVAPVCAAVKPQLACYEAYGAAGWRCLEATVAHARALGVPVILDGKRNDIGSTAAHYAQMAFGGAPGLDGAPLPGLAGPCDWLTVNPWLGGDGVTPFLDERPDAGLFILVKTSNPGSGELQDRRLADGGTVSAAAARLVTGWGAARRGASGLSSVGAVVGATWPAQARRLRECLPDAVFLVPGYGAQGGSAADALAGRRGSDLATAGVLVNNSRAILAAWQQPGWADDDYAAAARAACEAMNRDLAAA
jgi:orotidine-5'-phosphate decarboxylase